MKYKKTFHLLGILITALFFQSCFLENKTGATDQFPKVSPNFNFQTVEDFYQFLTYSDESYPLISAHRGGFMKDYPENCIHTFAKLASKMPIIIECDVRMSKDSVLVLMHDETLQRTSTGKGKVKDKTYDELSNLFLKDSEGQETRYRIPTLEQALLWGKGIVIYTLDVKQHVPYDLVINLIKKTKSESNSIIITYSANQAALVNRLAPDLMISASIKKVDDLNRLNNLGIPDNRLVAFVGTTEADSTLYSTLRQHGIKSILGTIGNLDRSAERAGYQRYAEFVEKGADILSTDRPFEAMKALTFYIDKRNIRSPFIL